jgi:hypothetical protein
VLRHNLHKKDKLLLIIFRRAKMERQADGTGGEAGVVLVFKTFYKVGPETQRRIRMRIGLEKPSSVILPPSLSTLS